MGQLMLAWAEWEILHSDEVDFYDATTWKAKDNKVLLIFKTLLVNSCLSQDDLDIHLSGKAPNPQAFFSHSFWNVQNTEENSISTEYKSRYFEAVATKPSSYHLGTTRL